MARNIVLVGFMGTGKTTVGSALAERLGWCFVDTDAAIEDREGCSIAEIFERKGEGYFRETESAVIQEVLAAGQQVVSTGGGAVLLQENCEAMLSGGFVVALKTPPGVLIERMRHDSNRPLLSGDKEERVHRLLEERKNAYDFAQLTIDTSICDIHEATDQIMRAAGLGGQPPSGDYN